MKTFSWPFPQYATCLDTSRSISATWTPAFSFPFDLYKSHSGLQAHLKSPGPQSTQPSPPNLCPEYLSVAACFAFVKWMFYILLENCFLKIILWGVCVSLVIFNISYAYSLNNISFLPQSNALEKLPVYYPCFASLNSEFFKAHSMLWWKHHWFGARETKPSSSTYNMKFSLHPILHV